MPADVVSLESSPRAPRPATLTSVVERIRAFNRGREPERLAMKYRAMRTNPFAFFRGTCHLFYQDWPAGSPLDEAPLAWISGDLHLENFGCYRGDNRLVYFDLNDFDESVLAPASWEVARLLTSAHLVAYVGGLESGVATRLSRRFLDRYRSRLRDGKARWVERATARGMVRSLLRRAKRRTQADLLRARTRRVGGRRRLRLDPTRVLPVPTSARAGLLRELRALGRSQSDPGFYQVLDVGRRVAGTGSLGVRRYIVLVRGRGPGAEVLLDLKEAGPAASSPYLTSPQPRWESPAQRVVSIQRWVQAASPALLREVTIAGAPFVARELQPTEDRLHLSRASAQLRRLERVVDTLGDIVASGHLRSGGRQGSATTDEWIAFAQRSDWVPPLLRYARDYSKRAIRDWKAFCRAGEFEAAS